MSTIQGTYKDIYRVTYLDIAFADSTRALSAEFYANGNGRIPVVLSLGCTDAAGDDLIINSFADAGLHIVNSINHEAVSSDNNSTWFISESANEFTSANYGSLNRSVIAPEDSLDPQRVIPVNSYVVYLSARDVAQVAASFYVSVTAGDGTVYSTSSTDFNYPEIMQLNVTGKAPKLLIYAGKGLATVTNTTTTEGGDFVFSRETLGYISSDKGGSAYYYNYYLRMIDGIIAKVEFNTGAKFSQIYSYNGDVKVESYLPFNIKTENEIYNGFFWAPGLHSENELVSIYPCNRASGSEFYNNGGKYQFHICREGGGSLCLTRLVCDGGGQVGYAYPNDLYIYDQYGNRGMVHFPRPDNYGMSDLKIANGPWSG